MFFHVLNVDSGETVYAGNSAMRAERAFEGRVVCGTDRDRRTVARERAEASELRSVCLDCWCAKTELTR